MMNYDKYLNKAKEEMSKVKYLDFTDDELEEIYEEYYQKVEPYLAIICEFKLKNKSITTREVRATLQVNEKKFRLMEKIFEELVEALSAKQSLMKMKAQIDLQKAIEATEFKNAKMIEMQLKRYDDEYNAQGDSVEVNLPKTLEVNIIDASVDESTLPDEQEE